MAVQASQMEIPTTDIAIKLVGILLKGYIEMVYRLLRHKMSVDRHGGEIGTEMRDRIPGYHQGLLQRITQVMMMREENVPKDTDLGLVILIEALLLEAEVVRQM